VVIAKQQALLIAKQVLILELRFSSTKNLCANFQRKPVGT